MGSPVTFWPISIITRHSCWGRTPESWSVLTWASSIYRRDGCSDLPRDAPPHADLVRLLIKLRPEHQTPSPHSFTDHGVLPGILREVSDHLWVFPNKKHRTARRWSNKFLIEGNTSYFGHLPFPKSLWNYPVCRFSSACCSSKRGNKCILQRFNISDS